MKAAAVATVLAIVAAAIPARAWPPDRRPRAVATILSNAALERTIYDQVNRYRARRGLRPLVLDAEVSRVARRHSVAMAAHARDVGHEGFDDRAFILRRTLASRRTGENVALNHGYSDPATTAVRGWIESPPHRRNMEGPYQATGVGVARNADGELYFTQLFVGY